MKKLLKATLKIAGVLTIGGAIAGYKDHLDNKRYGRKARTIYEDGIKRGLDWMCGMAALIAFWPLYIVIAIMVKTKLGSPVLFTQDRPGKNEKLFKLYKFRTMTDKRDDAGNLLSDDERLTRFGKLLRSTSLDELPEAFNIIKGDMSVIGPRPLLVEYIPYYTETEHHRHDVRPGLSGLAQVNGRNSSSWEEKFKYDLEYVKHCSLLNDVKLVIKTVEKAIKREDVLVGKEIPAGRLDDSRRYQDDL